MKKLFLLDYKKIDDNNELSRINNSVYQVLKRYALDIVDYENNELTEAIFIRLGWSNKYKDTIFSFFRTICAILEYFSKENEIKLDDGNRIVFYHRNNILKYKINENEYQYSKKVLYEKATEDGQSLKEVIDLIFKDQEIFESLKITAEITDSLSNFTPHPGYPFNQAKGFMTDVADSLNLMVDKIQDCIDRNEDLVYGNKPYEKVELDKLKKWKEWFINNQFSYCLNGFYEVTKDNKIKGKKLFDGQSLKKPLPETREEIMEYLNKIKALLIQRGETMDKSIR